MKFSGKNKKILLQSIIQKLEQKSEIFKISAEGAKQIALDAPGRMQSRYDTTKEEQSALHNALKKQYLILQNTIKEIKEIKLSTFNSVQVGTLVKVKDQNKNGLYFYFIISRGGGESIKIDNVDVTFISVDSLLGKALYGYKKSDVIKVKLPVKTIILKILEVR